MPALQDILTLSKYSQGLGDASTELAAGGSGESQPGGVENYIECNGLILNYRANIDAYLVTRIDGLSDADIRDQREVNPQSHGETAFDSYYSGRTLVLTGKIRAHTLYKLRDMQMALREAFVNLSAEYPLIFRSGVPSKDIQISVKKNQPMQWAEEQTDLRFWRDFQITLRASNPRFLSYLSNTVETTATTSPKSFVITNNGNFPTQPIFTLIGPMYNPRITFEGKFIQLNTNLATGQIRTIDTQAFKIYDQANINRFNELDISSTMLESPASTNAAFTFTATGLGPTSLVRAVWRHTYM